MLLTFLCALWIETACAQRDARDAGKSIAECIVDEMRLSRPPASRLTFMTACMETKGLRYRVKVDECPLDNQRLDSPFCWRSN
jgi:hypothetical protein